MNSRQEYRIVFSKRGDLRFISHRNVATLLERAARRADLPIAFSEGFNPRPRMSFPTALETGIESDGEAVFMRMEKKADRLAERLSEQLPDGITVEDVAEVSEGMPRKAVSMNYVVDLPRNIDREELEKARRTGTVTRTRGERTRSIELSRYLKNIHMEGNTLKMTIALDENGSMKPREVLEVLGMKDALALNVRRTHVELS